jgi:predicted HTH transcriptional regulator
MDEAKSKFLKALIEYPEETAEAEYKSAMTFDSKSEFGTKLVKHILGQSNAGGGDIIIGFREDDHGGLIPDPALDESVARSYETTRLRQSVDSYIGGGQRSELQVHKIEFDQRCIRLSRFKASGRARYFATRILSARMAS